MTSQISTGRGMVRGDLSFQPPEASNRPLPPATYYRCSMANEDSKYSKAWELISSGDDALAISYVVSDAMEGDLEALSILAIANINIGTWQDCDRYIQIAGNSGGRDFWFAGQSENYIYAAFIARLDSFQFIATKKYSHFESFIMTCQHLSQRDEDGAFYNAICSMRCLFAGSEVREDIESLAANHFVWVAELKQREIEDEKSLQELLEAISWISTCAFDLKFSRDLMGIYNSNWN